MLQGANTELVTLVPKVTIVGINRDYFHYKLNHYR